MHNANTPFTMFIPEDAWEKTGPTEDPRARLQTHIRINGLDMHLEAIQVKEKRRYYRVLSPRHPKHWTMRLHLIIW